MPINMWRYKQYEGDGCGIYQCLQCYSEWESRTDPVDWNFCPCCGIKWVGEIKCRQHGESKWDNLICEKQISYIMWQTEVRVIDENNVPIDRWKPASTLWNLHSVPRDLDPSVRRRIIALKEYKYYIDQKNETEEFKLKNQYRLIAISIDKCGIETKRTILPKEDKDQHGQKTHNQYCS